jgi:uncharacterized protein YbbC (DUF1343 family)
VYSDINFILLGEIVRRTSGRTLPEFVHEHVFAPLGMKDTMFNPPNSLRRRIAPTELLPGLSEPLRGVVHDPRARNMGGVAGHAGLFSTASDIAKFAHMMAFFGERHAVRVFSPLTIQTFTQPQSPRGQTVLRGLGWDIDSAYSSTRGDLFPIGSYGHTGFTGTSIWIDPTTRSYVVLMSNSVHPKSRPAISAIRGKLATVAAAGLNVELPPIAPGILQHVSAAPAPPDRPLPRNAQVLNGIDVLIEENFASLKGKRVGLITNHTGIARNGKRNIDAMVASGVDLKAIYSPEHGLAGKEDHENIGHSADGGTGLPVWSLYSGPDRRPTGEMLRDIDTLVFDIQDIGARFYTYVCTMANAMQEAAVRDIEFVVLDRPNPINGVAVEGPPLDPDLKSFVGCIDMPLRHGMTVGELASMVNTSLQPPAKLRIVKMQNWARADWFDSTGLLWVNPSPNMRSLNAALLYPGVAMLEAAKVYSVGRGTDAPFEQVGADWIRGRELAAYLNSRGVPGLRVYPTILEPAASNFAGEKIEGVRFVITDRDAFPSTRFGLELGCALAKLYPGKMTWTANEKLVGSRSVLMALEAAEDPSRIEQLYATEVQSFRERRRQFLLY